MLGPLSKRISKVTWLFLFDAHFNRNSLDVREAHQLIVDYRECDDNRLCKGNKLENDEINVLVLNLAIHLVYNKRYIRIL